jgi:hypothetical protein
MATTAAKHTYLQLCYQLLLLGYPAPQQPDPAAVGWILHMLTQASGPLLGLQDSQQGNMRPLAEIQVLRGIPMLSILQ